MPVVHRVVTRLITDKAPVHLLIVGFDLPDVDQIRSSTKATDTIERRVQAIIPSFTPCWVSGCPYLCATIAEILW